VLSKACNYAIRAALYIASHQDGRNYIPIREMSEKLEISFHFLTKILQVLTQNGIMVSFRGPHGGVALAREPKDITVKDIVVAIDGPTLFESCILGLEGCGQSNPCPLHEEWSALRDRLAKMFENMDLETLSKGVQAKDFRIANFLDSE
jgi:Rrf2 family protein